jgi:hypothetical protein
MENREGKDWAVGRRNVRFDEQGLKKRETRWPDAIDQ